MIDRVWLAAELHLGNRDVKRERHIHFERRFFEAWDHSVRKKDVVVLLGNIATGTMDPQLRYDEKKKASKVYWLSKIQEMPGEKLLILGTEDRNRIRWYYRFGFRNIIPYHDSLIFPHPKGPMMLSHLPAFETAIPGDTRYGGIIRNLNKVFTNKSCVFNFHGYCRGRNLQHQKGLRTFDVSLECINYMPILLDQAIELKVNE
jgi:calcineurin-like phosphoesterase family protein